MLSPALSKLELTDDWVDWQFLVMVLDSTGSSISTPVLGVDVEVEVGEQAAIGEASKANSAANNHNLALTAFTST